MRTAANPHEPVPAPGGEAVKLRITGVAKTFETAVQAVEVLQDVNLDIRTGEFVVLFGPSGCGKTTLLNLIAGFETPTAGQILLDSKPIRGPGNGRMMMFQEHALFPWLNVIDNVTYGMLWEPEYRFRRRKQRERAMELLELVHLTGFAKSPVHELSGGMKQRVALARALAPDPQVLLIDEPFAALDALVRAKLYTELQEILVRTRKTIVAVTHDAHEAACLGDRVVVFSGRPGRIHAEITIGLPRPREIHDPLVTEHATRITAQLGLEHEEENQPHA